jgi:Tol biopolymer transport system component
MELVERRFNPQKWKGEIQMDENSSAKDNEEQVDSEQANINLASDEQVDREQTNRRLAGDEQTDEEQIDETVQPSSSRSTSLWPVFLLAGLVVVVLVGMALYQQFGEAILPFSRPVRIAFMSERDGNWEVYIMDRDGNNAINLTNDPRDDGLPLHAAGQGQLAFVSDRDTQGLDLFLMNLDGSNVTKISDVPDSNNIPIGWSPDGKYLAIDSDRGGISEVFLMEVDGEGLINLTERDEARRFDNWAPKANRFILSAVSGQGVLLFVTNLDGSEKQLLTDGSYPVGAPQWSADGQKVAFMATAPGGGPIDIYVVDAGGGEPVNLTQSPANDSFPKWSPDGLKIAFLSDRDGNPEIYVMDADGNNQTNLTNNPANESLQGDFAWSPDGTQILFHSDRDGDVEIYIMDADGSHQVNLTNSPGRDFSAVWVE